MTINNFWKKVFFILYFFLLINVFPQSDSLDNEIISPSNRYKFGNFLFFERDYYRANHEYKKYLQYQNNDTVRFKIAYSLIEMGDYSEAEDYLKTLFITSKISDEAKSLFFKAKYLENNYYEYESLSSFKIYQTERLLNNIMKLKNYLLLKTSNQILDTTELFRPYTSEEVATVKDFYLRKFYPDEKSETKAALLSALLPGLGKIYTGQTSDGITSFIFNSVFGFLAYNNFKHNHNFRGWLFSVLTAYFYAGNIYGSVASAKIYNTQIQIRLSLDIDKFIKSRNYFQPDFQGIIK